MKRLTTTAITLSLVATLASSGPLAAADFTLKFGHAAAASDESPDHIAAMFYKSCVDSRSQGRIDVQIFPASQLGDARAMNESVQLGTLEMTQSSVAGVSQFYPELQVIELPYNIASDEVAEAVAESEFFDTVRDEILAKTGNIRMLGVGNVGRFRSLYTTEKVTSKEDLSGKKIRIVDSPMQAEFMRSIGAAPTPVGFGELYTSLATGVVEGVGLSAANVVPASFDDFTKFGFIDQHSYLWNFLWVSDKWLQGLPDDLQDVVALCASETMKVQRDVLKSMEAKMIDTFVAEGGEVYYPSAEDMAPFLEARDHMNQWWVDQYGDALIGSLRSAIETAETDIAAERAKQIGRSQ